jgi:hypothetical protein
MKIKTRNLIMGAMAIAIPLAAYVSYQYFRPPENVADMNPDMKVNAQTIGKDYMEDEMNADKKYLGKTVDIIGRVSEIHNPEGNGEGQTIYFEANETGAPVAVVMNSGVSGDDLPNNGDSVLIRGICTGFLMDVTFNRGVVIKIYK